jgi:hypothetical protein
MGTDRIAVLGRAAAFGFPACACPRTQRVTMPQPLIVSIPHKLGKAEALRRIKAGLGGIKAQYTQVVQVNEEIWSGDRLAFRITALKQQASGTLDVAEDRVVVEVTLPWLLAGFAHGAQAMIRERTNRMLEKKDGGGSA